MGGSDCELLRGGWLAQPVNAWSSTAYLAAAVYLVARRSSAAGRRSMAVAGAVALALVFLGSFAFHGPQPSWADAAHDASIAALLMVVLLHAAGSTLRGPGGVLLAAVVAVGVAAPGLVMALHGALAVAVAVVEVRRRRRREHPPSVADRVAVAALALGAVLFALGRTSAPLCSPSSPLQPHAGWHVATAVAAAAALSRPPGPSAPGRR